MIDNQQEYTSSLKVDAVLPLAPLIDMVFLIVIFFMVNASVQINSSIPVKLPEVENSSSDNLIETAITLTDSSTIYIENESETQFVDLETLASMLASSGVEKVILRADVGVTYGILMEVMDSIRNAGIVDVSLQTVPVSDLR